MKRSIAFGSMNSTTLTHALGLISVAITGVLFYAIFYSPLHEAQLDQIHRIEQLTKLIAESRAAKVRSGQLERELELLTQHVASVRERIPDVSNEAEMLRQLTTIAADSDFVVSDYRRGRFQQEGLHSRFEIGITGEGNYLSICKFLDGIDRLPRVNRIERLQVSTVAEGDTYPINLTISVFYGGSITKS